MITINANTKIATLLKAHPDALETIVSISPAFSKLRNPLLGKLMANRASIRIACKIGDCTPDDFFAKLAPLGFVVDRAGEVEEKEETVPVPDFFKSIQAEKLLKLDVRPIIEEGKDPLSVIMKQVKAMSAGQVLQLTNTFEPVPLIELLAKQGFNHYVETITPNTVVTYFHKQQDGQFTEQAIVTNSSDWEEVMNKYEGRTVNIDVRNLEMPLPMLSILDALEKLEEGKVLYVLHKRIPVFLLPELADRQFDYRIKTISDSEVHLLIYKR